MSFEDIKAHLDRLFAYRPTGSSREQAAGLRDATIEFKVALGQLRETLAVAETELERARRDAADYQRRGALAEGIGDLETVQIATEYTGRAQERVDVLERKVLVLRDEVHIAEREYEATKLRLQRATQGLPLDPPTTSSSLGGEPELPDDPFLDQRAREAAVEAQLAHLKKKLGREPQ
jgi:hypothetical protein